MTRTRSVRRETPIKQDIAAYLDSLGPRCWHVPFHNMGYTRSGIPDRLGCYRGHFFALEVKRDANHKPTAWQQRELNAIEKAEGLQYVVWSVEQARELIAAIDAYEDYIENLCLE